MHQVNCEQSVSGAGPVPSFPAGKQRGTEGNTTRVTPSGNAASGEGSCGGTRRESRRAEPGGGATCRTSPVPPRPVPARLPALQGSRYSAGSSCGGSSCRADSAAPRPAGPGAGRRRSDSSRRRSGAAPRPMAVARRGCPGCGHCTAPAAPRPPLPAGPPPPAALPRAGGERGGGTARPRPGWPPPPSLRSRRPIPPAPGADAPPTPYAPRGGRVPGGLPSGSPRCAAPPNGRPARPTAAPQSLRAVRGKAAARGLRSASPEGRGTPSP